MSGGRRCGQTASHQRAESAGVEERPATTGDHGGNAPRTAESDHLRFLRKVLFCWPAVCTGVVAVVVKPRPRSIPCGYRIAASRQSDLIGRGAVLEGDALPWTCACSAIS